MGEQGKKFITFKNKQYMGQNLIVYLLPIFRKVDVGGSGSKGMLASENVHMEKNIANLRE